MTKAERHRRDEQCLQAYQREQGKEGDALPFSDTPPYATVFPPQAQVIAPRQGVGVYACVVRLEPAGEGKYWIGEIPCRWDGQQWSREDGGRLRYGIQAVKSFIG
jgi:hypothetical protein